MIVAFDNTFLSLALNPDTKPTPNPATGQPASYCFERIESLIDEHSRQQNTVLIPTPCLAELLTAVPDVSKAIEQIDRSAAFQIASFDARCAIDLAIVLRNARDDKKAGTSAGWQEVKFDRQIATIAKVAGAEIFYTDDGNQSKFAKQLGLDVKHTWDLHLSQKYAQLKLIEDKN
ncbi:MAG: hypothetical protein GY807_06890 [Gammaproteobacteria bacterium]|nr:hypothetical protein [Gammaproteobacteria bacterium]